MYMNKTKRNLIMASAIVNLISIAANLILSIVLKINQEWFTQYPELAALASYFSTNLYYSIFEFVIGLVGSIFLLFTIREKGKYFRSSQGLFIAGFVIIVISGGLVSWILLFVSLFVSDVIVINAPHDVRREERQEERDFEEKKKRIEELKTLRDSGIITEEEYKEKLLEIL